MPSMLFKGGVGGYRFSRPIKKARKRINYKVFINQENGRQMKKKINTDNSPASRLCTTFSFIVILSAFGNCV